MYHFSIQLEWNELIFKWLYNQNNNYLRMKRVPLERDEFHTTLKKQLLSYENKFNYSNYCFALSFGL